MTALKYVSRNETSDLCFSIYLLLFIVNYRFIFQNKKMYKITFINIISNRNFSYRKIYHSFVFQQKKCLLEILFPIFEHV